MKSACLANPSKGKVRFTLVYHNDMRRIRLPNDFFGEYSFILVAFNKPTSVGGARMSELPA